MSTTKLFLRPCCWDGIRIEPKRRSFTPPIFFHLSTDGNKKLFLGDIKRFKRDKIRSKLIVRSVPTHSGPPLKFIKWMVKIVMTVILPFFFSFKWASIFKLSTAATVTATEKKLVTLEKLAAGIEKVAAMIAIALPRDGWPRKSVELVEHVAKKANYDATLVDNFVHKVEEVDGEVEDCAKYVTGKKDIREDESEVAKQK